VVQAIGSIKDNPAVTAKVEEIANTDSSYRARCAALQALGRLKTPTAYAILSGAVKSDSPDGYLRNAALRSFGTLGDDKAVPLLRRWAAPGKDLDSREAAISSLARLDKDSTEITNEIAGYLKEAHFGIRLAAISALGSRGDASALPALEALLNSGDLSITVEPMIREQIAHLKNLPPKGTAHRGTDEDGEAGVEAAEKSADDRRLGQVEKLLQEMNERLKAIESRLPVQKG
jgi:HEAT repeat protein